MGDFWCTSIISEQLREKDKITDWSGDSLDFHKEVTMRKYPLEEQDLEIGENVEIEEGHGKESGLVKNSEHHMAQSFMMIQNIEIMNSDSETAPVAVIDLTEAMEDHKSEGFRNESDTLTDILKEANISLLEDVDSSNNFHSKDGNQNLNAINEYNFEHCHLDYRYVYDSKTHKSIQPMSIINMNGCNQPAEMKNTDVKMYHQFDAELAVANFQDKCDLGILLEAERRVLLQPMDVLCHRDEDGDTPLMIIVAKRLEESPRLYENLFALQERILGIRICCKELIAEYEICCPLCGSSDIKDHHTPLSFKNIVGDSALTCAIKMQHSQEVIDYLLAGLAQNENDLKRIFDEDGIPFLRRHTPYYPSLLELIKQLSVVSKIQMYDEYRQ